MSCDVIKTAPHSSIFFFMASFEHPHTSPAGNPHIVRLACNSLQGCSLFNEQCKPSGKPRNESAASYGKALIHDLAIIDHSVAIDHMHRRHICMHAAERALLMPVADAIIITF